MEKTSKVGRTLVRISEIKENLLKNDFLRAGAVGLGVLVLGASMGIAQNYSQDTPKSAIVRSIEESREYAPTCRFNLVKRPQYKGAEVNGLEEN